MASSISWQAKTVFGNKRVHIGQATLTDGTDVLATGLRRVDAVFHTAQTAAADGGGVVINTAASANGDIKFTSGASASVHHIMVIGR